MAVRPEVGCERSMIRPFCLGRMGVSLTSVRESRDFFGRAQRGLRLGIGCFDFKRYFILRSAMFSSEHLTQFCCAAVASSVCKKIVPIERLLCGQSLQAGTNSESEATAVVDHGVSDEGGFGSPQRLRGGIEVAQSLGNAGVLKVARWRWCYPRMKIRLSTKSRRSFT